MFLFLILATCIIIECHRLNLDFMIPHFSYRNFPFAILICHDRTIRITRHASGNTTSGWKCSKTRKVDSAQAIVKQRDIDDIQAGSGDLLQSEQIFSDRSVGRISDSGSWSGRDVTKYRRNCPNTLDGVSSLGRAGSTTDEGDGCARGWLRRFHQKRYARWSGWSSRYCFNLQGKLSVCPARPAMR